MTNIQLSPDVMQTKVCKECKLKYPLTHYRKYAKQNKYYYPYCKSCVNKQQIRKYHAKRFETPVESLECEKWLPVIGYEGLYEVSNLARIKRVVISVPHGYSGYIKRKERLLTQNKNKDGYRKVILSKDNIHKVQQVHLIVWDAFGDIKRDGYKMVVDHKDNNKENNAFVNLQYITQRENTSKDRKRKSNYVGVYLHSPDKNKKWQAKIYTNGKSKSLGLFYTEEEAAQAYQTALNQLQNKAA